MTKASQTAIHVINQVKISKLALLRLHSKENLLTMTTCHNKQT